MYCIYFIHIYTVYIYILYIHAVYTVYIYIYSLVLYYTVVYSRSSRYYYSADYICMYNTYYIYVHTSMGKLRCPLLKLKP